MGSDPSKFKGANRPVERVSWDDAVEFCKKLTEREIKGGRVSKGLEYQLPTDAQWEYACRAGTTTVYSWGDSVSSSNANYNGDIGETTPVGKYPANPWGFHDMEGNVCEWCADWYSRYSSDAVTDPKGQHSFGSYRVVRGGCWDGDEDDLRSARRGPGTPSYRDDYLGFRISLRPVEK